MKASSNLIDFIKGKEAFRSQPYDDGFGNMTVGYGNADSVNGSVTQAEAERALKERISLAEQELAQKINDPSKLTQGQMDTLIDMHYNMGVGNMQGMIDRVNSGDLKGAGEAINMYVYATNKNTGKKEIVPGLVKRAQARTKMWGLNDAPMVFTTGDEGQDNSDLAKLAEEYLSNQPKDENSDLVAAAESYINEDLMAANIDQRAKYKNMDLIGDVNAKEDVQKQKEILKLSKETGRDPMDIEASLSEKAPNYVLAETDHKNIVDNYPANAEWLKNPMNYALKAETGDYTKKVEIAARPLSDKSRSDLEKIARSNVLPFIGSYTHLGMLMGQISNEDGFKLLTDTDLEAQANQLDSKSARTVQEALQNLDVTNPDTWGEFIATAAGHPASTIKVGAQSLGASIAPFFAGLGVGAGVSSVATPVAGAVAGFTTSAGLAAAVAFGDYMNQQLEEFRRQDGTIDYRWAYSDPERVKRWRKEAAIYSGAMGASEGLYTVVAGKIGSKIVAKGAAKSTVGKVATKVAGVAGETAVEATGEMIGESGGLTAAQFFTGKEVALKENLNQGLQEAAISPVSGGIMGGSAMVFRSTKEKASRIMGKTAEVNKANESTENLSNLKATVAADPAVAENLDQIGDLVKETAEPKKPEPDENAPVVEDIDSLIPDELSQMEQEAFSGTVRIAPSEFFKYHEMKGTDPMDMLPPDLQQAFLNGKKNDQSIIIPVSDWVKMTLEDPEIEIIVREGTNDLNGLEANETADTLEGEAKVFVETIKSMQEIETEGETASTTEDTVGQNTIKTEDVAPGTKIEIIEPTSAKGNIVSRPVRLYSQFSNMGEKEYLDSLISRIKGANKNFDEKMVETFALLQLRHEQGRAEMLGVPLADLTKNFQIAKMSAKEARQGAVGWFERSLPGQVHRIVFRKDADAYTIAHEFGHLWLWEMGNDYDYIMSIPDAQLTIKQREYKEAMEHAHYILNLDKFGVTLRDIDTKLTDEQRKWVHETFAETASRYLWEGKYEGSRVRALMESFRGWMRGIIKSVMDFAYVNLGPNNYYPSLAITPKVERMFEAILNVSDRVEEELPPMFQEPLFDPKNLGELGPEYEKAILDARSEAIGRAYTKFFLRGMKEREKMIDKELNRIYDEAEKEVDEMKSMKLLKGFQNAYKEWSDNGKQGPELRISFESFQELTKLDEGKAFQLREKIPREVISGKKKGGMDIRQLMFILKINRPEEMIDLLLEMGQRDQMIRELAERKVESSFPVMKTDEEIHAEAEKAVNNEGKEKLLQTELKILVTKYWGSFKGMTERLISPAVYLKNVGETLKMAGIKTVGESPISRFSSKKFLLDSHRAGRQAARMFKASNMQEAFEYKEREAINYYAHQYAVKAEQAIAGVRARLKQVTRYAVSKDIGNKFDADLMRYARTVVAAVKLDVDIPQFDISKISRHSMVHSGHIAEINSAIAEFVKVKNGKPAKAMTVDAYLGFGAVIKAVMKAAADAKAIEIGTRKMKIDMVGKATSEEIMARKNVVSFKRDGTAGSALRRAYVNTRTLFDSLYGSAEEFAQSTLGSVFQMVLDAEAVRNIEFDKNRDEIVRAVKSVIGMDKSMRGLLAPLVRIGTLGQVSWDETAKPIAAPELDYQFENKGQLWYAFLLMGSKSGAEKFLGGIEQLSYNPETGAVDLTKWNAFKDRMIAEGVIGEKDFKMMQRIWDVFRPIHPLVADAARETEGFEMGEVKGWDIDTPFGTFTGGYVPVAKSENPISKINIEEILLHPDMEGMKAQDLYPRMATGFMQARNDRAYEVNLDMSKLTQYLSASLNIAYLRRPLIDFGKIISHPEVKKAMETRRPGAIKEVITPWYMAVTKQEYTEPSSNFQNWLARSFRKNVNIALYFGNFVSAFKQPLGFFPAASEIGKSAPHRFAGNLLRLAKRPKEFRQEILSKSKVMQNRMEGSQMRMIRSWEQLELNFDWLSWHQEKISQLTYFQIQFMQNMVDLTVWKSAYEKGLHDGMTEAAAIRYADGVVNKTQSSPDVSSMSNIQRGNDIYKLFTSVTSVDIALNNMLRTEAMRDPKDINKAKAMASIAIIGVMTPVLLQGIIAKGMEADDEDDEEKDTALIAPAGLALVDAAIPVWGRVGTSMLGFGKVSVSPVLNKLNKLPRAKKAVYDKLAGDVDMSDKALADVMEVMTMFSGVGEFSIIGRGVMFNYDNIKSEEDKMAEAAERTDQISEYKDSLAEE